MMLACLSVTASFLPSPSPSLSPALPPGPFGLGIPLAPRHLPVFGGFLETCISRHFPTVRAQGSEVCGGLAHSP